MWRDDVVRLAEQSTLGALVHQPAAIADVRRWLRPNDFADLWHANLYTALLDYHEPEPLTPTSFGDFLLARLGTRSADLPRLFRVIAAAPPHPAAVTYARMVLDGGLRREVAGLGILLQAAALNAAVDHSAHPLVATCSLVDAGLDAVASRWACGIGMPRDDVVVPLNLRAAVRNLGLEARTAADRYLAAYPARDPVAEHDHVVALVGSLIAHPDLIPTVTPWLPATRIKDAGWRTIYTAAVELAELDQPVDLTTVAWTAHTQAHHGPDLPDLDALRAAVDLGYLSWAPAVIGDVAADHLRHVADIGAAHLHDVAANPRVLVEELIDAGHTITTALRTAATAITDRDDRSHRAAATPARGAARNPEAMGR